MLDTLDREGETRVVIERSWWEAMERNDDYWQDEPPETPSERALQEMHANQDVRFDTGFYDEEDE